MPALPWKMTPLALLGAALLAVAGCGSGSEANRSVRSPIESIFEAPAQLLTAPGPTLEELRRLGVDRVRVTVPWASIAPDASSTAAPQFDAASPGAYPALNWTRFDELVRAAAARGIGVFLDPGGPAPQWATSGGAPHGAPFGVWKPQAAEFGQFVRAVGTRYSGSYTPPGASSPLPRVSFWSIWNEPNYGVNLAPQAIDHSTVEVAPRLYRGLLDAAWKALKQTGHGNDVILIGELAPRGITTGDNPGNFSGMVPLRFLRALYCVNSTLHPLTGAAAAARGCPTSAAASSRFAHAHPALFAATGFAAHPYPQGALAPNLATPDEPDYADLATLHRLEITLDELHAAYGSGQRLPIYSTEFGYKTNPPLKLAAPPALAAAYLNWAEYLSWRDPRIRSWDQYLLVDPPATSPSSFVTGLRFADGTPKPSLAAYRMPIYLPRAATTHGHALEVWGCVRPAHYAQLDSGGRAQIVKLEFAAAGRPYRAVTRVRLPDPSCYFDVKVKFASSGTVRLAWSYPHGAVIHSRAVPVTIR